MQTRNKHSTKNKIARNKKIIILQIEGKEKRSTLFSRQKTNQKNANSTKTIKEFSKLKISKGFFMCWKGKIKKIKKKKARFEKTKVTYTKKEWEHFRNNCKYLKIIHGS